MDVYTLRDHAAQRCRLPRLGQRERSGGDRERQKLGRLAATAAIAKVLRVPIEHLVRGVSGEAAA
jgi:hypothetical protein